MCTLDGRGSYNYTLKKLDADLKNRVTPLTWPSIKKPPILELKALPLHLCYVFSGANNMLSVIIVADLVDYKVEALVSILKKFKKAIGWSIANNIGIFLGICTHKIRLDLDCVPSIKHHRRLNLYV